MENLKLRDVFQIIGGNFGQKEEINERKSGTEISRNKQRGGKKKAVAA